MKPLSSKQLLAGFALLLVLILLAFVGGLVYVYGEIREDCQAMYNSGDRVHEYEYCVIAGYKSNEM